MFLLTSLVGCCKAAPSWSKRWLLTSRGCSALKKAFFSSEPCRWHSEPCVSNSVRSHCLPFPALYSAEAVAMAKTLGRYGETRWFSFRCVNIFWMLSHHFQAKVEKECAANLLNIIIFFFFLWSLCILCQAGLVIRKSLQKPLESSGTDLGIVEKVHRKGLCSLQGYWKFLLISPCSDFASLHGLGQVT